ncbi:hypothetical protein [Streptomyces sp. JW3]|uniref:hypothetical protein n=1 Tax=Streptomyces sp. JW3 TaxID=3456955 RepID=UPI003FA4CF18
MTVMVALCEFIFVVAVLALLYLGIPFLLQRPLRKHGKRVTGWVIQTSVPQDGQVKVCYGYHRTDEGEEFTLWDNTTTQPGGSAAIMYDPENPKRARLVSAMTKNPERLRLYLILLSVIAVATFVVRIVAEAG